MSDREEIMFALNEMKAMITQLREEIGQSKAASLDVMNVKQAAKYLNLSEDRVRHLVAERNIPHFKMKNSNRNYFKRAELDGWRAYQPVKTNNDIEQEASRYILSR